MDVPLSIVKIWPIFDPYPPINWLSMSFMDGPLHMCENNQKKDHLHNRGTQNACLTLYTKNVQDNSNQKQHYTFCAHFVAYRKVTNSSTSYLVACQRIFRLFINVKLKTYLLWTFGEKFIFTIVAQSTVRNTTSVDLNEHGIIPGIS